MATYWTFTDSQDTVQADRVATTVTIMFTDIVGSTAMATRLGDRQWKALLQVHDRILRGHVKSNGGTEVKSMGDGFMLTFPSARQAVRCAAAVQREMAEHERGSPDTPLRLRMGLSVGEPVREEQDLFGHSVILAARICAKAKGHQVLASHVVPALLGGGDEIKFSKVGDVKLKGLAGAHELYEVLWKAERSSRRRRTLRR